MSHPNDQVKLRIATIGRGDRGSAKNQNASWGKLKTKLRTPTVDAQHTIDKYLKLAVEKKNKLKDVGSFVLGAFEGGIRKRENIHFRSGVALDIDATSESQIEFLRDGLSEVCKYEFFAHTTRSHTPANQRWRAFFPTSRPIAAEEYNAVSRILASKIFPSMEQSMDAVDDVSFRVAQIMYWPSVCRGAVFEVIENPGELLDVDALLESFPGWEDWSQLPYSEKRGQKRPAGNKKAEIPTEKRGLVGAFCRAYDVPAAIEKFIPDVYKLTDPKSTKPRYTYLKGTGAHGAVIEDKGLFLYSHHGSDPCGERLVNSFDMVRLHKFGELDTDTNEDTYPTEFPSYQAMEEFSKTDEKIVRQLQAENYDIDEMFDIIEESSVEDLIGADDEESKEKSAEKKKKKSEWMLSLDIDGNGFIKPTLTNLSLIIQNDPRFRGLVAHNEFIQETVIRKKMKPRLDTMIEIGVENEKNGDLWQDHHDRNIRVLLEAPHGKGKAGYGLKVTDRDLTAAVDLAARKNAFHPIREMFERLVWDGEERLDTLFVDYLGCVDNAYTRAISRLTLVAAVTRTFEPGHKFDYMTIVEGLQGLGKSTFFSTLAMGWFAEMEGDFEDRKKAVETMRGALIVEVAELSQFNRAEVTQIKQFVSANEDKVRLSYDRREKVFPRQSVFVGTTNESAYLRDTTGNRRFWPVKAEIKEIDIPKLRLEAEQIWAEAVKVYREMRAAQPKKPLPLYLVDEAAREEAKRIQESRRIETTEDAYVGMIEKWVNEPVIKTTYDNPGSGDFEDLDSDEDLLGPDTVVRARVCLMEIHIEMLGGTRENYGRSSQLILSRAMSRVPGWQEAGLAYHRHYGRQKIYERKS